MHQNHGATVESALVGCFIIGVATSQPALEFGVWNSPMTMFQRHWRVKESFWVHYQSAFTLHAQPWGGYAWSWSEGM